MNILTVFNCLIRLFHSFARPLSQKRVQSYEHFYNYPNFYPIIFEIKFTYNQK